MPALLRSTLTITAPPRLRGSCASRAISGVIALDRHAEPGRGPLGAPAASRGAASRAGFQLEIQLVDRDVQRLPLLVADDGDRHGRAGLGRHDHRDERDVVLRPAGR